MQFSADPGVMSTHVVRSLVVGNDSAVNAAAFAEARGREWAPAAEYLKSIVAPYGSADAANMRQRLAVDIRGLYRPLSLIGRLVGLRRVSFNHRLTRVTAGSMGAFTGRGSPIPASRMSFSGSSTLEPRKAGAIVGVDEELARSSDPSAQSVISRDMSEVLRFTEDRYFVDPSNAGSSEAPASITNGAASRNSTGSSLTQIDADLLALVQGLIDAGSSLEFACWILSDRSAVYLANLRGSGGQLAYPNVKSQGVGELLACRQIATGACAAIGSPSESFLALVDCSAIWIAEGSVDIQIATSAAIEFSDSPTNNATTGTAADQVALFQTHTRAVRAIHDVNWARATPGSVQVLRGLAF